MCLFVLPFTVSHTSFGKKKKSDHFLNYLSDHFPNKHGVSVVFRDTASGLNKCSCCLFWVDIWTRCTIRFSFILLQVEIRFSQHHLLKSFSFLHCVFLAALSNTSCPSVTGSVPGSTIVAPSLMSPRHTDLIAVICGFLFGIGWLETFYVT